MTDDLDSHPERSAQPFVVCPECGSPLRPGGRFCPACGIRVVEESGETGAFAEEKQPAGADEVTLALPPLPLTFGILLPAPGVDLVLGEPSAAGQEPRPSLEQPGAE